MTLVGEDFYHFHRLAQRQRFLSLPKGSYPLAKCGAASKTPKKIIFII